MASITLEEANRQLTQVNIAIENLLNGKRFSDMRVTTAEFTREYRYGTTTLGELTAFRRELLAIIDALSPVVAPTFRSSSVIPLVVYKGN